MKGARKVAAGRETKVRWDSSSEVSSATSFHPSTVKRWCTEKRVTAKKVDERGNWRVLVYAEGEHEGWPVTDDELTE
jgi:hypothetical protein